MFFEILQYELCFTIVLAHFERTLKFSKAEEEKPNTSEVLHRVKSVLGERPGQRRKLQPRAVGNQKKLGKFKLQMIELKFFYFECFATKWWWTS